MRPLQLLMSVWFFFAMLPRGVVAVLKVAGVVTGLGMAALLAVGVGRAVRAGGTSS